MNMKIIKPIVSICKACKKSKVTSHHILCDGCWSKKAKQKDILKKKKLLSENKNLTYLRRRVHN